MHILLTGFTPRGVGSDRILYDYLASVNTMKPALEQAGHTFDHRAVRVGEMGLADKYDILMVTIAIPQSLSSRFLFGAMWAMEQFPLDRIRFTVDDWLLHQMESQLSSGLREPEKRLYRLDNRWCRDEAMKHTEVWKKWFTFLRDERYKLLLPAFPWAKTEKITTTKLKCRGVIFDPTPYAFQIAPSVELVAPEDRERAWTLAAMRDVKPWLDGKAKKERFTWPLEQYGNKRQGQPVVEESELITQVYPHRWGIVGAPYGAGVAGGGGWRARYVHSVLTESILYLDPEEQGSIGGPYRLRSSDVEKMSTDQLLETAESQAAYLRQKTWSMDQLISNLDKFAREG